MAAAAHPHTPSAPAPLAVLPPLPLLRPLPPPTRQPPSGPDDVGGSSVDASDSEQLPPSPSAADDQSLSTSSAPLLLPLTVWSRYALSKEAHDSAADEVDEDDVDDDDDDDDDDNDRDGGVGGVIGRTRSRQPDTVDGMGGRGAPAALPPELIGRGVGVSRARRWRLPSVVPVSSSEVAAVAAAGRVDGVTRKRRGRASSSPPAAAAPPDVVREEPLGA